MRWSCSKSWIGAAFEQDVALAFLDDGVFQLVEGQDTAGIGMKNFSKTYRALGDFEVRKLYVEREFLKERGLSEADLMPIVYEDENEDYAQKPSIHLGDRFRACVAGRRGADDGGRRARRPQGRDLRHNDRTIRARCEVYALGPDLAARGLEAEDLADGVKIVGYDCFVDLAASHARVCAWL